MSDVNQDRNNKAFDQIGFLFSDLNMLVNKKKERWFSIWFSANPYILISYRFDRVGYLSFHANWKWLRLLFSPIFFILTLFGGHHDIHYSANIGRGLKILHPSLGIVVSGYTIAGEFLTLTGGNCIGGRKSIKYGDIQIGNNVNLGANAVILGPVNIGSNSTIGAGAVVINDSSESATLVGVPAKPI